MCCTYMTESINETYNKIVSFIEHLYTFCHVDAAQKLVEKLKCRFWARSIVQLSTVIMSQRELNNINVLASWNNKVLKIRNQTHTNTNFSRNNIQIIREKLNRKFWEQIGFLIRNTNQNMLHATTLGCR